MNIMGIDIGTTSVSIVLIEKESGNLIARETAEHRSFLTGGTPEEKIQDPERIYKITKEKTEALIRIYGIPSGIGLTGQMHGILYVDEKGKCISPLYTWQDGRGNLPGPDGKSLVEEIYEKYQVKTASGYGLVTHLYHIRKYREDILRKKQQGGVSALVQECIAGEAVALCTIADYFGMTLTGRRKPLLHTSMADSLGFFDGEKGTFRKDMIPA